MTVETPSELERPAVVRDTSRVAQVQSRQNFAYQPRFDGLRGAAVLCVMVFHAMPFWLPGGFLGVDVFFVLSGFLITTLLLKEWSQTGRIRLGCFYMRRVLRLIPALWLMLLITSAVSSVILDSNMAGRTRSDARLAVLNILNWARAFELTDKGLLGHTWSLCVEEQFYLLWPAALCLVLRAWGARALWRRILTIATLFSCYRCVLLLSGASIERVYNGLDSRVDNLLLGCALSALIHEGILDLGNAKVRSCFNRLTPAAIMIQAALLLNSDYLSRATYLMSIPLTGLTTATLIAQILSDNSRSWIGRALESPGLVYCGRISYGLYLWHYPLFHILGKWGLGWSPLAVAVVGLPLTFAIAGLSYTLVENRILRLKGRFQPGRSPTNLVAGRELAVTG